jgi:DNA invertase Pin-like site-specific DNA recombinase
LPVLVAEMERGFILERRRAGIEAVRKRGVYKTASRPCRLMMRRVR